MQYWWCAWDSTIFLLISSHSLCAWMGVHCNRTDALCTQMDVCCHRTVVLAFLVIAPRQLYNAPRWVHIMPGWIYIATGWMYSLLSPISPFLMSFCLSHWWCRCSGPCHHNHSLSGTWLHDFATRVWCYAGGHQHLQDNRSVWVCCTKAIPWDAASSPWCTSSS